MGRPLQWVLRSRAFVGAGAEPLRSAPADIQCDGRKGEGDSQGATSHAADRSKSIKTGRSALRVVALWSLFVYKESCYRRLGTSVAKSSNPAHLLGIAGPQDRKNKSGGRAPHSISDFLGVRRFPAAFVFLSSTLHSAPRTGRRDWAGRSWACLVRDVLARCRQKSARLAIRCRVERTAVEPVRGHGAEQRTGNCLRPARLIHPGFPEPRARMHLSW